MEPLSKKHRWEIAFHVLISWMISTLTDPSVGEGQMLARCDEHTASETPWLC